MNICKIFVKENLGFSDEQERWIADYSLDELIIISQQFVNKTELKKVLITGANPAIIVRCFSDIEFCKIFKHKDFYGKNTILLFENIDDVFEVAITNSIKIPKIALDQFKNIENFDHRKQMLSIYNLLR